MILAECRLKCERETGVGIVVGHHDVGLVGGCDTSVDGLVPVFVIPRIRAGGVVDALFVEVSAAAVMAGAN